MAGRLPDERPDGVYSVFTPRVKRGRRAVRVEFEDDDLRRLYVDDGFRLRRLDGAAAKQFRKKVAFLHAAADERDLYSYRALRFEKLLGTRTGQHSIRLDDRSRLIVRVEREDADRLIVVVNVVDYQ
jgi:proteic killer suppression protein